MTQPSREELLLEVLAALTNIADIYSDSEDDSFQIFRDCDQEPVRVLTLGICRSARLARSGVAQALPTNAVALVAQAMLAHQMNCEMMGHSPTWENRAEAAVDALYASLPASSGEGLSEAQRRLDASVTPKQARANVRSEREASANRNKPKPQPDGFINDYD